MSLFKDTLLEALATLEGTPSAIAQKHGISQSQMSAFTSGKAVPKDDTLVLLCEAFQPSVQARLAKAWVEERLGTTLADLILSTTKDGGTRLERLFTSLPGVTQAAFLTLMEEARASGDLRGSLERLASYITPSSIPTPREDEPPAQPKNAAATHPTPPATTELGSNRLRKKLHAVKQGTTTTL